MGVEKFILSFFEFVGNIDFNIFSTLFGLVFILFWLVLVGWVWIDSGERTSKNSVRFVYVALALILNIPGLIIYLIVRPSETIEQIYWADLERRYLKYETSELGDCPKCGHQLLPGFVFCSNCGHEIKKRCPKCGVLINKDHKYCEHCGLQLRDKATSQKQYPDVSVMEQQIQATKEHVTETVEGKRTRYKTGKSLVVKLGDSILAIVGRIKESIPVAKVKIEEKSINEPKKEDTGKSIQKETIKKKNKKKKKKRK